MFGPSNPITVEQLLLTASSFLPLDEIFSLVEARTEVKVASNKREVDFIIAINRFPAE